MFRNFLVVHHIDGFLEIAVASIKFKCLKAECLIKLGRIDVKLI